MLATLPVLTEGLCSPEEQRKQGDNDSETVREWAMHAKNLTPEGQSG
jgi:hypothetical protein